MARTNMARKRQKTEEFEVKHDYNPDFLEALCELTELYAKGDDFRAASFERAIVALQGQIITGVDDIELFRLGDLKGVGKATLQMYKEFIETGKIERLEELRTDHTPGFLKALNEIAELYEEQDDFRATSFRRAVIALEGKVITGVEDIKKMKLDDLKGVGKATLEMLTEFIETGKIQRLERLRPATSDQVEWFASLKMDQADHIQTWWDLEGERDWATED